MRTRKTGVVALAIGGLVVVAGACNKVGRDQFETTVAELRSEMNDQDQRITANADDIDRLSTDVDSLRRSLDGLRRDFQVRIEKLENGLRFATPVHFDFDRADIRASDRPVLDRFASVAREFYPGATITVEGFADPAGSQAYNRRLSQRRAESVKSYLVGQGGLSASNLRTAGYGETRLVRPGAAGPGAAGIENRRVTFVVEWTQAEGSSTASTTERNMTTGSS